jgi:hypothetical protein
MLGNRGKQQQPGQLHLPRDSNTAPRFTACPRDSHCHPCTHFKKKEKKPLDERDSVSSQKTSSEKPSLSMLGGQVKIDTTELLSI